THRHRGRLGITELADGLDRHLLGGLACLLLIGGVLRQGDRGTGPGVHRDRVNRQDGDRGVPDCRLVDGPFQRAGGVGRSIDANRDTRHLLPPSSRAARPGGLELFFYFIPFFLAAARDVRRTLAGLSSRFRRPPDRWPARLPTRGTNAAPGDLWPSARALPVRQPGSRNKA